jgi:hypothetical protein
MCFYGFSVSFVKTETLWAKYTLCIFWALLFILANLGQGNIYRTKFILWLDVFIAICVLLIYAYLYFWSIMWWEFFGAILIGLTFFVLTTFYAIHPSEEYIWVTNIWHMFVILIIFLVPNSLEESKWF